MKVEIDYLTLARQARLDGNGKLFWQIFKQHARVHRKLWAKKKATSTVAPFINLDEIPWEHSTTNLSG